MESSEYIILELCDSGRLPTSQRLLFIIFAAEYFFQDI